jgi:hypothetical protein
MTAEKGDKYWCLKCLIFSVDLYFFSIIKEHFMGFPLRVFFQSIMTNFFEYCDCICAFFLLKVKRSVGENECGLFLH